MNDDIKLLGMLLSYARRRMVTALSQVEARFDHDAKAARFAVIRLERRGSVYVEGGTLRLTLRGFAHAVASSSATVSVARIRRPAQTVRSRAA